MGNLLKLDSKVARVVSGGDLSSDNTLLRGIGMVVMATVHHILPCAWLSYQSGGLPWEIFLLEERIPLVLATELVIDTMLAPIGIVTVELLPIVLNDELAGDAMAKHEHTVTHHDVDRRSWICAHILYCVHTHLSRDPLHLKCASSA